MSFLPTKLIPLRPYTRTSTNFFLNSFLSTLTHSSCTQTPYPVNPTFLINLLNAASQSTNARHVVTQIHAQLITNYFIPLPFLLTNLLNLYAKCGCFEQTLLLFSTTADASKNVVAWTSLITQFSHIRKPFQALTFFNRMRCAGVFPNRYTFSAILPACAETSIVLLGQQMHCLIRKHGVETDVFVCSALVDMYAKCCFMSSAETVFEEMPERNLVSWNSMIVGFLQNKFLDQAILFFSAVLREDVTRPDEVSFSSALTACANAGASEFGRQVHGVALKLGMVNLTYVNNSLMDMYSKCGLFNDATKVFWSTGVKDAVSWNILIIACVHNENFDEACNYFGVLMKEGVGPDETSYSSVLHACASLAKLYQGAVVHGLIIKAGFVKNTCAASSLITMYGKCGSLMDADRVFEETEFRNVVCWSAMIAACQQHGCANQAIQYFQEMLADGIKPDYITFVSVLSACSHAGRIEEGLFYFDSMNKLHGVNHGLEHYACVSDMLGRAGRLSEAKMFVDSMPFRPDSSVWGALLGACRHYGNLELGREVAQRLFELEPGDPGNYVLLSNMLTRKGMSDEAGEIRRLMGIHGLRKEPGCSWIDVKNSTFVFTVHDRSHAMTDKIYEMLQNLEDLVRGKKGYEEERHIELADY